MTKICPDCDTTVHTSATPTVGGEREELAHKAAMFAEGTRRQYERGNNKGDMWFFELWHFLGDIETTLAQPASPLRGREAAIEECAKLVENTGLRNHDNIARDIRRLSTSSGPLADLVSRFSKAQLDAEYIARTICLSYGRDPDAMTSIGEMCDEDNRPVPIWMVYEEQADAVVAALSTSPPEQPAADPVTGRDQLRKLVDIVWNEATESTQVPSTKWADRMIDRAFPTAPDKEAK